MLASWMRSPPITALWMKNIDPPMKNIELAMRLTAKLMTETWFAVIRFDAMSSNGVRIRVESFRLIVRAMKPSFGLVRLAYRSALARLRSAGSSTSIQ